MVDSHQDLDRPDVEGAAQRSANKRVWTLEKQTECVTVCYFSGYSRRRLSSTWRCTCSLHHVSVSFSSGVGIVRLSPARSGSSRFTHHRHSKYLSTQLSFPLLLPTLPFSIRVTLSFLYFTLPPLLLYFFFLSFFLILHISLSLNLFLLSFPPPLVKPYRFFFPTFFLFSLYSLSLFHYTHHVSFSLFLLSFPLSLLPFSLSSVVTFFPSSSSFINSAFILPFLSFHPLLLLLPSFHRSTISFLSFHIPFHPFSIHLTLTFLFPAFSSLRLTLTFLPFSRSLISFVFSFISFDNSQFVFLYPLSHSLSLCPFSLSLSSSLLFPHFHSF
ncbi:unnamed protein product [Acanthosepion pharaonis]|uniref:Uncharacterized protein n=1 Tax=Acanthosepion pharaonis TaxID=158019 RepID=A0A812D9E8_ACAPH|nr:unnamed protein product [Sepia pharaonis]